MFRIRFLAAVCSCVALTTTANSADLSTYRAPEPTPLAVPFAWDSFYAGGGVGYRNVHVSHEYFYDMPQLRSGDSLHSGDPTGFVTVGFDKSIGKGAFVGLFTDYDFGSSDRSGVTKNGTGPTIGAPYKVSFDNAWSAGARVGVTPGHLPVLLYLDGGYSLAGFSYAAAGSTAIDRTVGGWFGGGGIEYGFRDHWSLRGEYRYTDFGDVVGGISGSTANPCPCNPCNCGQSDRFQTEVHTFHLGLTYRFGAVTVPEEYVPLK